jgi:hypothetical protein
MFNLISKKTIGTTGVTLALLVGGLLASPVSNAFAKPFEFEPVTRAEVRRENGYGYHGYTVWSAAQYPYFTSGKSILGLAAIRRLDK